MGRLLQLLRSSTGEESLWSRLGSWRIAVSRLLDTVLVLPWPGSLCSGPLVDGAVQETLPAGATFPTDVVWYRDASKTSELLRLTYTRNGQGLAISVTWLVFDLGGSLVLTVTDTISYDGVLEVSRTRAVSW
jgi:hypothetical protein